MIFDIVPNLIASALTTLFPIFASYKALRTSDPAQLAPWLMYWVVFSCFSLFDFWTYWALSWIPFYAWLRLCILLYLMLPQTQGARTLYQCYVHPFLAKHEQDLDRFINNIYAGAKAAGLNYLKQIIAYIRTNLLGIQAKSMATAYPHGTEDSNYTQSLLSRFNLPSTKQSLAAPAGDFYGFVASALGSINTTSKTVSREAQVDSLSKSGTLIPAGIISTSGKLDFLSTQRENMRVLLSALDREASDLGAQVHVEKDVERRLGPVSPAPAHEELKKSKSEAEFEEIGSMGPGAEVGKAQSSSWMPWSWGSKVQPKDAGPKQE